MDRSAVDTIRGYCYQVDKTIIEIFSLPHMDDSVDVECIEDIDVYNDGHLTAIQCKYYESTEYNHSVISKPIRLMLTHYKENKQKGVNYYLFGHYKAGQHKLALPLSVDFFKTNFLTYIENKIKHEYHIESELSDEDLTNFLNRLVININAKSFLEQKKEIIHIIKNHYQCAEYEAEHYLYSNAFRKTYDISCNKQERKIKKRDFVEGINKSRALFNLWLYEYEGRKEYLKKLKESFFRRGVNTSPYARFFLLESKDDVDINEIKDCIYHIQKNWSNLSKRLLQPYSPFLFIYGISKDKLWKLKNQLFKEELFFNDGYPFKGSDFTPQLLIDGFSNRDINFQFINDEKDFNELLKHVKIRKEVYQFYIDKCVNIPLNEHQVNIQVKDFSDIKEIV
ncbi:MAG: DUF4297 family anti-phage-associated protein [Proteus vulgaris]